MTFVAVGERTTLFRAHLAFFINSTIGIIKKARRAKKEVGKRSKSKQPDKIEREIGKPGNSQNQSLLPKYSPESYQ